MTLVTRLYEPWGKSIQRKQEGLGLSPKILQNLEARERRKKQQRRKVLIRKEVIRESRGISVPITK